MAETVHALTQAQAAELAGLTVQGLKMQSASADPPAKGANGYHAREFGQWLKRRHLRGVGVTQDGTRYDYEQERARLTKSQADKTELEAQELRGEVVRAEVVIETWARMLGALKARLLSMPTKAGPRVRGTMTDEEAAAIIEAEVIEALEELSEDGLDDRTRARRARSQERAQAAAASDGERMGGSVPDAVPRKRGRARKVAD